VAPLAVTTAATSGPGLGDGLEGGGPDNWSSRCRGLGWRGDGGSGRDSLGGRRNWSSSRRRSLGRRSSRSRDRRALDRRGNWSSRGSRSSSGLHGDCASGRGTAVATSPDSRAGEREVLLSAVDAEVGVWVGGLVSTGELNSGARSAASTVHNLDLDARNVVLRLVDVASVDTNVLVAHQVLAGRSAKRNFGGDVVAAPGAPGVAGEVSVCADTLLEDLEPVGVDAAEVLDAVGSLGHVHKSGTGVLHLCSNSKLEADFVTGADGQDIGLAGGREGALVADDIGSVCVGAIADIGSRVGRELDGVVLGWASRHADILEGWLGDSVLDVGVHEVMGGCHLGNRSEENSVDLHSELAGKECLWLSN